MDFHDLKLQATYQHALFQDLYLASYFAVTDTTAPESLIVATIVEAGELLN